MILVVATLSGLVVWWRGIARWVDGLGIAMRKNWKRLTYDTHGALGFWAALFLFGWGLSGIELAFPDAYARIVASAMPTTIRA